MPNLSDEVKRNRKEISEIEKNYNKEHGKDKVKRNNIGDPDFSYRSFVLFDGTEISEGSWYNGRKWMTAKYLNACVDRWVKHSYDTGYEEPDIHINEHGKWIPHQCGGCRLFAALDLDYGFCCNLQSPNEGRITFEHGGCKEHSDYDSPSNE